MENTTRIRFTMKMPTQTPEEFVRALSQTNGLVIRVVTADKCVAAVEMSDELANAIDGVVCQVG